MVVCTGLAICLSSGRFEQRLAICVGSKCAQAHFKDGSRSASGQACLSKSTLVLSLEGTSAGCFEATQIKKTSTTFSGCELW